MTCRWQSSGSPERQRFRLAQPRRSARGRCSSGARDFDAARDYLLLELLDARVNAVRNESAIAVVVDVPDAAFLQAEGVNAALEGVVLHSANRIKRRGVHALHH